MMTQKVNPYTKLFSTLSEVRMMSCSLSQLNILCRSPVKPYYTNMIHPLFTVHTLLPFYVFSNVLDFIEAEWSIYQNVQYFIRSKNSVLNFTTVRHSLHKCSETLLLYYA